jgi:hypothetical protein
MTDTLRHRRSGPLAARSRRHAYAPSPLAAADDNVLPAGHPPIDKAAGPAAGESASGSTADLMYRLLIGDIALQRGEPAGRPRYYESAREARDAGLRAARPKSASPPGSARSPSTAKLWSELDPRRTAEADHRSRRRAARPARISRSASSRRKS